MTGDAVIIRGDACALPLPDRSVDAVVTDPPYGLEFMGKEWDGADGFRRSLNPADAGRDNVFGRTSRTSPEYRTTGAGQRGAPGIGERPTEWVSNRGWNGFRCRKCGHLSHGGSPCHCDVPDFVSADNRWYLYQAWCEKWAAECLRVLRPGGHLVAFGGTRTSHRLTCAIEDAGFEVRDAVADLTGYDAPALMWIYATGFPKSLDVAKAIDRAAGAEREVVATEKVRDIRNGHGREYGEGIHAGARDGPVYMQRDITAPATDAAREWEGWGTALKPGWEPILLARKPLAGNVAANVLAHGTGALNIDGCRVAHGDDVNLARRQRQSAATAGMSGLGESGFRADHEQAMYDDAGRWPPNILLGPEAAAELDAQSGVTSEKPRILKRNGERQMDGWGLAAQSTGVTHADEGGASRFFPVFRLEAKAPMHERPRLADGTAHATVKPVDLLRWLTRLVTPPGGLVLDCFAGSGTTGEAAIVEGFRCVLIEKDPGYVNLIRQRLGKPIQPDLFGGTGW